MSESKTYKLILTSKGFNTLMGKDLIRRAYEKEKIKCESIFLITFPEYEVDEIVVKSQDLRRYSSLMNLRENQFARCPM